ncbi:TPA: group II intron reverse transcriptase/maturase [Legionella pneumophila]|nr:group II intron reverse transcriptase/maturase [Legionella pneumophila]MCZ4681790.1 group II intron reverse transcriptase/maturase [Legionella pneumophila]HDV5789931.1 group II intron reverse transcriptase/maturase [Legionella pneumophila]HDV5798914.1 group II intron reverse transcriptase/maturase [Legionella pneumophila]HDV5948479.1 group II intron reverse transcriptase/maturase [Legionella pneumophila]
MTAMVIPLAGAPSPSLPNWSAINWKQVVEHVRRLQIRIAKAYREGKHSKAKSLQWILSHSFYAKLFAVKRVVQNRGSKTPGVDNVMWKTKVQKIQAATSLKRRGYQTKPLKRIYIPKKQKGKLRPLSIPPMACRAMQALHLLALEPIAEMMADKSSYGFRPLRSAADAIEKCFKALSLKRSSQYVLEGDIRACFDSISHQWLIENIPVDKEILRKWLRAGYIEKGKLYSTELGTPQGGIISPTLLTITLSGLESAVKAVTKRTEKVNVCIYADDFIITGANKEVLENKVKPAVEAFLNERGLSLSKEKTKITHINDGFDFLGMNIRKYKGKLIIKPAKDSVKEFLADIRETIKSNATSKTVSLISLLNPKIRGWSNYYRHVCSSRTFNRIDHEIFKAIWRWAVRRHPHKGAKWVAQRYFHKRQHRNWVFGTTIRKQDGNLVNYDLILASKTTIQRHILIRSEATPYDPAYHEYFDKRVSKLDSAKRRGRRSNWWTCWWRLFKLEETEKAVSPKVAL